MDFQPGDIVTVKSGGPNMTVSSIREDAVFCTWFVQGNFNEAKSHSFNASVLKKVG
jgi:uncharacterized protein YodC (DUF2158 family)